MESTAVPDSWAVQVADSLGHWLWLTDGEFGWLTEVVSGAERFLSQDDATEAAGAYLATLANPGQFRVVPYLSSVQV